MRHIAWLVIRLTTGGLLTGHGAQKLFGWFGGSGPAGTARMLESLGIRPGRPWAYLAGLGEFLGGTLTALGLFHPFGPMLIIGVMSVATGTAHRGKPIWVAKGGAELPVTNMANALGLTLAGPGRFSLDSMLGIGLPRALVPLWAATVLGIVLLAVSRTRMPQAQVGTASGEAPAPERRVA